MKHIKITIDGTSLEDYLSELEVSRDMELTINEERFKQQSDTILSQQMQIDALEMDKSMLYERYVQLQEQMTKIQKDQTEANKSIFAKLFGSRSENKHVKETDVDLSED